MSASDGPCQSEKRLLECSSFLLLAVSNSQLFLTAAGAAEDNIGLHEVQDGSLGLSGRLRPGCQQ